jgi:hypothetical protein
MRLKQLAGRANLRRYCRGTIDLTWLTQPLYSLAEAKKAEAKESTSSKKK